MRDHPFHVDAADVALEDFLRWYGRHAAYRRNWFHAAYHDPLVPALLGGVTSGIGALWGLWVLLPFQPPLFDGPLYADFRILPENWWGAGFLVVCLVHLLALRRGATGARLLAASLKVFFYAALALNVGHASGWGEPGVPIYWGLAVLSGAGLLLAPAWRPNDTPEGGPRGAG